MKVKKESFAAHITRGIVCKLHIQLYYQLCLPIKQNKKIHIYYLFYLMPSK